MIFLFLSFYLVTDINLVSLPKEEVIASYYNKDLKELKDFADKNNINLVIEYEYSDEVEKLKLKEEELRNKLGVSKDEIINYILIINIFKP